MRARLRQLRLVVAIWAIAVAVGATVAVASIHAGTDKPRCTHGLSSIGPVTIVNGTVVGGSTVPHTEACLP